MFQVQNNIWQIIQQSYFMTNGRPLAKASWKTKILTRILIPKMFHTRILEIFFFTDNPLPIVTFVHLTSKYQKHYYAIT